MFLYLERVQQILMISKNRFTYFWQAHLNTSIFRPSVRSVVLSLQLLSASSSCSMLMRSACSIMFVAISIFIKSNKTFVNVET